MFPDRHFPTQMEPGELDRYLAKGWYRMGQSIFTTHFLNFGDQFYSAIWIRLPLQDFTFKKRQRKLFRQNSSFKTVFRKAVIDEEKERLYQRYREHFPGTLAPSLNNLMYDELDYNIYDTREASIYDGERLIAFSFYDLGKNSSSSIVGVYHPAYQKHSLGYFSMLLEMQHSMQLGLEYYYPGYVVPGYPRFDYKLRIGEVEYLNLYQEKWLPYEEFGEEDIPLRQLENMMRKMEATLELARIPNRFVYYPHFSALLYSLWMEPYLSYPYFIHCFPEAGDTICAVTYDLNSSTYRVVECYVSAELSFSRGHQHYEAMESNPYFRYLFSINETLATAKKPHEIVRELVHWRKSALEK
jgi:arginyl-tRNA--protein-N-Asp/Glu arginylyltransferase